MINRLDDDKIEFDFEGIGAKLEIWAFERHITKQRSDRNGFCANIMEEMSEYVDAIRKNDTHEIVDAISDIIVFSMVEMHKMGISPDSVMFYYDNKHNDNDTDSNFIDNIIDDMGLWLNDDVPEKFNSLTNLISHCAFELLNIGYEPAKVLHETFREINSRTGEWDENSQKWKKYKTLEAMRLWYNANYEKCKIV